MSVVLELDRLRYARVAPSAPSPRDPIAARATQVWDVIDPKNKAIARAEIYEGEDQWGVRLHDRAPEYEDSDLVRIVAHLLVWHAHCRTETVDVVLGRTHEHHTLVRVSGDYV